MADIGTKSGGKLLGAVDPEAVDRLKAAAGELAAAEAEKLLTGVGRTLGRTTGRLNAVAEGSSPGFQRLALDSGRKLVAGKGPVRTAVEVGAGRLKAVKRKKGGGRGPTVVLEYVDVPVPVHDAYEQWPRFLDAIGAEGSTTTRRRDRRLAWTSESATGRAEGVATFHAVTEDLTRVVLLIEHHPKGLAGKSGALWRAQDRRVRSALKHYARHLVLLGAADESGEAAQEPGEAEYAEAGEGS
ncbi:cyclase/dehydrase [Streptomyces smyrnaeus]|uniref:cyclase/dehydrase n=1 Tax=Streptomyces smyrnaeus TaxID=1387713 RepID=UPI0036A6E5D1